MALVSTAFYLLVLADAVLSLIRYLGTPIPAYLATACAVVASVGIYRGGSRQKIKPGRLMLATSGAEILSVVIPFLLWALGVVQSFERVRLFFCVPLMLMGIAGHLLSGQTPLSGARRKRVFLRSLPSWIALFWPLLAWIAIAISNATVASRAGGAVSGYAYTAVGARVFMIGAAVGVVGFIIGRTRRERMNGLLGAFLNVFIAGVIGSTRF